MNKVMLIGNLGKDPEVKHLAGGSVVAKFSIATNEKYKNKAGEYVDNTEWHNVEVWGKLAGVVEEYLKKGSSVYVEGKIKTEQYEEKYYTKIIVFSLEMLGGKPSNEQAPAPTQKKTQADTDFDNLPF